VQWVLARLVECITHFLLSTALVQPLFRATQPAAVRITWVLSYNGSRRLSDSTQFELYSYTNFSYLHTVSYSAIMLAQIDHWPAMSAWPMADLYNVNSYCIQCTVLYYLLLYCIRISSFLLVLLCIVLSTVMLFPCSQLAWNKMPSLLILWYAHLKGKLSLNQPVHTD